MVDLSTSTTAEDRRLESGSVIAGRYKLIAELGVGAMGSVWSAEHLSLGSRVALKFLKAAVLDESEAQSRFVKEARLSARLGESSRYITRVFDHGVLPTGTPYIVMELLRGESLADRLERDGRLSMPMVEHVVSQLTRALEVAHAAKVVHRDLKPANIFLQESPEDTFGVSVKLLDFGVAKSLGLSGKDQDATVEGVLLGTPRYMSPEHFDSCFDTNAVLDERADLWSCAAIVYRMVSGVVPFDGASLNETMRMITTASPQPIYDLVQDVPAGLHDWFAKCFAKDPRQRYQNAGEFLTAFLAAINSAPRQSHAGAGTTATTALMASTTDPTGGRLSVVLPGSRRIPAIAAVVGIVGSLLGIGMYASGSRTVGPAAGTSASAAIVTAPTPSASASTAPADREPSPSSQSSVAASASDIPSAAPSNTAIPPAVRPTSTTGVKTKVSPRTSDKRGAEAPTPRTSTESEVLWKKKDEL